MELGVELVVKSPLSARPARARSRTALDARGAMARLELVRSESICAIAACAACIVAIKLGQTYHESQIEALATK